MGQNIRTTLSAHAQWPTLVQFGELHARTESDRSLCPLIFSAMRECSHFSLLSFLINYWRCTTAHGYVHHCRNQSGEMRRSGHWQGTTGEQIKFRIALLGFAKFLKKMNSMSPFALSNFLAYICAKLTPPKLFPVLNNPSQTRMEIENWVLDCEAFFHSLDWTARHFLHKGLKCKLPLFSRTHPLSRPLGRCR